MRLVARDKGGGGWRLWGSEGEGDVRSVGIYNTAAAYIDRGEDSGRGIGPMTPDAVAALRQARRDAHGKLEDRLGQGVDGYLLSTTPMRMARDVLLREVPDGAIGCRVWGGSWVLLHAIHSVLWGEVADTAPTPLPRSVLTDAQREHLRVLEVGAGCGLVSLCLASMSGDPTHRAACRVGDVVVTDTASGYDGAEETWMNLVHNVRAANGGAAAGAARLAAVALDWVSSTAGEVSRALVAHSVDHVDLIVGADIVYDPRVFAGLVELLTSKTPSPPPHHGRKHALIVQNTARQGTEEFKARLRAVPGVTLRVVPYSAFADGAAAAEDWQRNLIAGAEYELWGVTFTPAMA